MLVPLSTRSRALAATTLVLALAALAGCGGERVSARWDAGPDSTASAFARTGGSLAWPGATRAFEVRDDGDLWNGAWRVSIRPGADGATAGPPKRIVFEDRWRPVVHWRRTSGDVRWDFEACALPARSPDDSLLFVSLAIRARNTGARAAACSLRLTIAPPPARADWVASDAPPPGTPPPAWHAREGRPFAGELAGAAEDVHGALAVRTLAPGEAVAWRAVLASAPLPARAFARFRRASHAACAERARRHWDAEVARGTRFELRDAEVEDALRAARVVLLQSRIRVAGVWQPTAGPFQYRDVWLRDGARSVAALAAAGYGRESRELADGLARLQWSTGAFLSQRGQTDGVGQAMWAFAQAALRPAPDSSAARYATLALAAAQWIETQRRLGAQAPWPFADMLPYADPRDGELVRAQLVGNDAWALAGLESASRLLRAAARPRQAAHVDSLRASYAADFRANLARTHRDDVPPSWQGIGLDWGNLAVGWPTRALPARDPRLAALAARTWAACPEPGLASYAKADSVHGYLGADLGTWALLADRPADAQRVLDALLRWRDATGAGAEVFSLARRDYGDDLPPHPMCAAALTALVRDMVVFDDADTLQLTLGPRASWWRGARVSGAPTRWGAIDLAFDADASHAHWAWSPVDAWTELTLPAGTTLAADAPAPLAGARGARTVLAPPRTREARVTLARSAP